MDISVSGSTVAERAESIRKVIIENIISFANEKRDYLTSCIQNSSGEFVDKLVDNIGEEADAIINIGEALNAVVDYVVAASNNFARVDANYNRSKIN